MPRKPNPLWTHDTFYVVCLAPGHYYRQDPDIGVGIETNPLRASRFTDPDKVRKVFLPHLVVTFPMVKLLKVKVLYQLIEVPHDDETGSSGQGGSAGR